MEDIAIRVQNLSKVYNLYNKPMDRMKEALSISKKKYSSEYYALNDISFDIKKGETVGIIGTNGSGKSTILKIITGVLNPTKGTVDVNGKISALLELGAGFNMEYTGVQNIYLNGTMCGFSNEEIDAKVDSIVSFADIGEFINQPVKTYSSGMFVRLAFAVAINIEPEILIVDEALSVGDVFFQVKCYKKFEEFKRAGKTILFVTHDMGSISKYCDRAILLNKGTKLYEGDTKEAIDIYKKVLVGQEEVIEEEDATEVTDIKNVDNWKSNLTVNPNVVEYGTKKAEIIDYCVIENNNITNTICKNNEFSIKIKVRFNETIENPIFAFTIKTLKGVDVTGTNTLFEKWDTGIVKKNETREITFTQKMVLQGGQYMLDLGCTGYIGDDFTVYHRLYEVCNISVVSDKNTVGFFDTNSTVTVK